MSELAEKVAVVTGASSGIGRATAEILARNGARVVVFARSTGKLESLTAQHGDRMHAVAGDVGVPEDLERLFMQTQARFGPCEILVNNAGMIDVGPLVETT